MMVVTAHDERSRDYTISVSNAQMQAAAQAPAVTTPAVAWQHSAPAAPFYTSTAATAAIGQVPAWNPNMQPGAFAPASTAYTSQPLMANSMQQQHYPAFGSSSFQASHQMPQYGIPPAAPPQAPPAGQPMYFQK